ncbi:MAG: hypothetical protein MUE60_12100 [Candidatus Eisenbacteria bacterium]|nr:hypothetical protein [Candidatus Eisenbacteria bacterium]
MVPPTRRQPIALAVALVVALAAEFAGRASNPKPMVISATTRHPGDQERSPLGRLGAELTILKDLTPPRSPWWPHMLESTSVFLIRMP